MNTKRNLYELLRVKNILGILDGDINFGQIETDSDKTIPISMPYLSGPTLCDISNRFGLAAEYGWNGGSLSRWAYLDNLIAHCIEKNTVSDLLAFLFSKEQFIQKLNGFTPEVIENAYATIVSTIISQINGALYFGGNELIQVNNTYIIHPIDSPISVVVPTIKTIDRQYISDLSNRAMKDVNEGNFDSAITKSRTLLEETFCYVIEKKGDTPSDSGDIGKLYNQVKQLYNMHQDKNMDKRINGLLSGLEKILSAIAEMRNVVSDSHGVGAKRISIAEHHAKLFVNAAMIMADFILSVEETAAK